MLVPGRRYGAFSTQAEQDFYEVNRFYSRPEDDTELHLEKPDPSLVPKPPEVPDLDFHQALSALGDQPAVLRALGIILDVTLPVKQLLDNGGGTLIWAEPLEGRAALCRLQPAPHPAHRLPAGQESFPAQAAPRAAR